MSATARLVTRATSPAELPSISMTCAARSMSALTDASSSASSGSSELRAISFAASMRPCSRVVRTRSATTTVSVMSATALTRDAASSSSAMERRDWAIAASGPSSTLTPVAAAEERTTLMPMFARSSTMVETTFSAFWIVRAWVEIRST